jgi:N6-L-threonylcarbamoyladenine synthase
MKPSVLKVLGIETSCDETAVAIVAADGRILSNLVWSQIDDHAPYGGVVPEIAARAHMEQLERLIRQALAETGLGFADLDAVAVTAGPGLIGGLMVGVMTAKAIASVHKLPFLAINHLEGHGLTVRLSGAVNPLPVGEGRVREPSSAYGIPLTPALSQREREHATPLPFPYLLLLASGGHCQFIWVEGVGRYTKLGGTLDDAMGEAFDKTAKLLGIGFPGGPQVEIWARRGDASRFTLPKPLWGKPSCDFSFSGLKTAVRHAAMALPQPLTDQDKADVCAAFQATVGQVMADRLRHAIAMLGEVQGVPFVMAGGVAANQALRQVAETTALEAGMRFIAPPMHLCTDNAAMIAWAGVERLQRGESHPLDFAPRARWPLG